MYILKPNESVDKIEKVVNFDDISFVEGILSNKYILVIGSEVMLNREKYPEANGDINVHLLNKINKDKGRNFRSLSDAVLAYPLEISPLHKAIFTFNYNVEDDDISPELKKLLRSRFFKFVFTTTPDHHVETVMKNVWGDDLKVINFSDETSLRKFCDGLKSTSAASYSHPTLFYVFGKAIKGKTNPTKFLETDNNAITYIEDWIKKINNKEFAPLIAFLKEKRIFSIGCNFDDWYHRFFLHILTSNFIRDDYSYNDDVVLGSKTGNLEEFLSLNNVCVHSNPWSMLDYINHVLSAKNGDTRFIDLIKSNRLQGKVFISYKNNPDHELAQSVFETLTEQTHLNVWFDNSSLLGGQPYNQRIPNAIKYSQVFIPILTPAVAKILNEYNFDQLSYLSNKSGLPYFIQEWKWASEVEGLTVIPIVFEGFDKCGSEMEKFNRIICSNDEDTYPSCIDIGSTGLLDAESVKKNYKFNI